MVDINFIRENPELIKTAARNKNIDLDVDKLLGLDVQKRELQASIDALRQQRNELAQQTKNGKPTEETIEAGKKLKNEIAESEISLSTIEEQYKELMAKVPTVPSPDTPIGTGDEDNPEINRWGEIPQFDFTPKTHMELGKDLGILDLEKGTKVGGYRGYYLKNEGTLLVMAFMNYALHKMYAKGYTPMIPPTLVKQFALFGSGYFKGVEYDGEVDEIYQVATSDKEADGTISKDKKFLVGTAEPSLLAYFADEVLKEEDLPIKVCGYSPCYRSEIGSYGKDTKGIYRVHEFFKVEQVVVSVADTEVSGKLQDEMVSISKEMHEDLGLPYRQLQICTGDMSPGKYRAFDIEAWMPGLNRYGETGSASNFVDWQARRLNVKYIDKAGKRKYAYLLNNTALPSPRIFIAILENYQQADSSVKIPPVLHKYMPEGMVEIRSKNLEN
jgi:seryl-tRNA synthetase